MASILSISQGFVSDTGNRKSNKVWQVINTTIEDENILMVQGFLPLIEFEDNIPDYLQNMVDAAYTRFFTKGMFLLEEHLNAMNEALGAIGYQTITLTNDSNYFQPVLPGKYKPCLKSWKNNGTARTKEMKQVYADFNTGKLDLDLYRVKNVFQELMAEVPETKATLFRLKSAVDRL